MRETRTYADSDLTVIPAQRGALDDLLEILHDEPATGQQQRVVVASRPRRSGWVVAVLALVAGVAVGLPLGIAVAPAATTDGSVPAVGSSELGRLLRVPASESHEVRLHTQRQLIRAVLTPH